ncbi:MAG: DUF99 family protein [Leptospirillia bacterium]
MPHRISHVTGFDDAPFEKAHRGDVRLVGAVFAGERLHGVLTGKVRRDGVNATLTIVRMVQSSRFFPHLQAVMLQGIAFGGFNVVDIHALSDKLGLPVLVVMRKAPDMAAVKRALLSRVPGGARKWGLIERAGAVEAAGRVFMQRAGIGAAAARELIARSTLEGDLPEPLRTAHLIAGGLETGESRGRA